MENRTEMEIDLLGLLIHLKTKIWLILLATLIAGIGGYLGTKLTAKPAYTAVTQVYVHQISAEGVSSSDLGASLQIRKDCAAIIKGEAVTREVVERLNLPMSPQGLGSMISVSTEADTRILNLSYTDSNPQRAALIINCVREVSAQVMKDLMNGADVLTTLYDADTPSAQATANIRRNTIASAVIGCVVMLVLVIVVFLLDDTIRTEDDVDSFLGLSTLAAIPTSPELRVTRGGKTRKRASQNSQKQSQRGKV